MVTYISLLKGINVGGHKKIPMAALREVYEGLGLHTVRTYIQSGNVLFETAARPAPALTAELEAAIATTFGFAVAIVLRTADQLRHTAAHNPFLAQEPDPAKLHVAFFSAVPSAENLPQLAPFCTTGEQVHLLGADLYLWYPNGLGRSKLTNDVLERKLGGVATMRNWNTVNKLVELCAGG